jgi:hypothetical protein
VRKDFVSKLARGVKNGGESHGNCVDTKFSVTAQGDQAWSSRT